MKYYIHRAPEFDEWFDELSIKNQVQIINRLTMIKYDEYFGDHKFLIDDVWELRWLNGRRVYYAYIKTKEILVLLGGNKNGQKKDITKAKRILRKHS